MKMISDGPDPYASILSTNGELSLIQYFSMDQNASFIRAVGIKHFCFSFAVIKASAIQKCIYRRIYAVPKLVAYRRA